MLKYLLQNVLLSCWNLVSFKGFAPSKTPKIGSPFALAKDSHPPKQTVWSRLCNEETDMKQNMSYL